jgi:hypothetical protein
VQAVTHTVSGYLLFVLLGAVPGAIMLKVAWSFGLRAEAIALALLAAGPGVGFAAFLQTRWRSLLWARVEGIQRVLVLKDVWRERVVPVERVKVSVRGLVAVFEVQGERPHYVLRSVDTLESLVACLRDLGVAVDS